MWQLIKGCDPKLVETILNEVIPRGSTGVSWADVAGQDKAKVILISDIGQRTGSDDNTDL